MSDSQWERAKSEHFERIERDKFGDFDFGANDSETRCACGANINEEPVCFFCGWHHIEKRYIEEEIA